MAPFSFFVWWNGITGNQKNEIEQLTSFQDRIQTFPVIMHHLSVVSNISYIDILWLADFSVFLRILALISTLIKQTVCRNTILII